MSRNRTATSLEKLTRRRVRAFSALVLADGPLAQVQGAAGAGFRRAAGDGGGGVAGRRGGAEKGRLGRGEPDGARAGTSAWVVGRGSGGKHKAEC